MSTDVLLTRQPVLNKQRAITANRLLVHCDDLGNGLAALDDLGDDWPGERTVFLSFEGAELDGRLPDWLAPENAMVEMPAAALAKPEGQALAAAIDAAGIGLCLEGYVPGMALPPAPSFHFLLADTTEVARITDSDGITLACNLADSQAFDTALKSGFDGAAGWFFLRTKPTSNKLIPAHAQIVRLLNLVRKNAEVREIEAVLKQDVALSFKLLRYINSAGFGLSCEIQSFRHAVTILGLDKLHKWLSVLLVTSSKDPSAPALMQAAVARGRFMEIMGRNFFDKSELDNLFITGAFSLLSVLVNAPIATVLEEMHLPEAICDALLRHDGVYSDFLQLALACENARVDELRERAMALGLAAKEINRAHMQALSFADRLQFS